MPSRKGSKNKTVNPYTLKDMYQLYLQGVDKGGKFDIGWERYKEIATALLNESMEYILEGHEVRLPNGLGVLRVKKFKTRLDNLKPNYHVYQQTGLKTYFLNLDSNGYYPRFFWNRAKTRVKNLRAYTFRINWHRRKEMSKRFKEGQDYAA